MRRLWTLGLVIVLLTAVSNFERHLATSDGCVPKLSGCGTNCYAPSDRPVDPCPVVSLEAYPSQLKVLGRFLRSFVRQNELFAPTEAVIPLAIVDGAVWRDPEEAWRNGKGADSLVRDPVKDSAIRWVAAGADISHLMLFRAGDSLWAGIELRRPPSPTYDYRIYLRAVFPDGASVAQMGRWGVTRQGDWHQYGRFLWYRVNLEELRHPTWIALAAETRQGEVLDFTAWYLLYLGKQASSDIGRGSARILLYSPKGVP